MFTGEHCARSPRPALNFISDHDNIVRSADVTNLLQELRRCGNESALALHRLNHNRGNCARINLCDKRVFQLPHAPLNVLLLSRSRRTAIHVRERQAVDFRRKRTKPLLKQRVLAGHGHGHVGAPVIRALEHDDCLASGIGTGDLHCCLDCLRAAVEQCRFLLKVARCDRVEQLCQVNQRLVAGHNCAHVNQFCCLCLYCGDHFRVVVTDCQHPNAPGEVEQGVAVNVGDCRALCRFDRNWRQLADAACH